MSAKIFKTNPYLLEMARAALLEEVEKDAFTLPPGVDPAMAGGMPPDGGMPPGGGVSPGGMVPPGAAPGVPPQDPSMMAAAAPPAPAAPPIDEIRNIVREEVQNALIQQKGGGKEQQATNIQDIRTMLTKLLGALGLDSGVPTTTPGTTQPGTTQPATAKQADISVGETIAMPNEETAIKNKAALLLSKRMITKA